VGDNYINSFFDSKRSWSHYKDSVLSYYLKPYLAKVKKLGKPLYLVDMFAGRGRFKTGEPGSPVLIAEQLAPLAAAGVPVHLLCVENNADFYKVLNTEMTKYSFAETRLGNCVDVIDYVADLANSHTTFLYADPCEVSQLHLGQLSKIYAKIRTNSSVEVLLVFMARAFLRQATALLEAQKKIEQIASTDSLISTFPREDWGEWVNMLYGRQDAPNARLLMLAEAELTAVAGGDYWREIALSKDRPWGQRLEDLVEAYKNEMRNWFSLVESFPIHADYGDPNPKYWIVFGSRYPPALDLFNRAACNARRKQGVAYRNEPGSLFADVSVETKADPYTVDVELLKHRCAGKPIGWAKLRWAICSNRNLGRFTDSEIDSAIQRAIDNGLLRGSKPTSNSEGGVLVW